ncbi:hypothetical protein FNV43_RR00764 [Rhamnella rubrinervis]|uniref:Uncharacterized protein n=1 Tax=Rhamnella rubrinervis TaxID=2594499 RepID=A0A8K0HP69_9ROSA|nr:hypothetical protein FNV43_RR00764 [Rhamnella rubrinervis]
MKMKFIIQSCYKLDPIENENDGGVKCFFKEHFYVGTIHTSLLSIKVEALQGTPAIGERDTNPAIPFAPEENNRLSSSISTMDINRSRIRNEEYSNPQNEIEKNTALNLHDGNHIIGFDCVLPIIEEHDRLFNRHNYDINYDDYTNIGIQEDIALDDDIKLDNVKMKGDDKVNDAFEVPSGANCDAPCITGFRTDNVSIPPFSEDSHRHHLICNESICKQ